MQTQKIWNQIKELRGKKQGKKKKTKDYDKEGNSLTERKILEEAGKFWRSICIPEDWK